MILTVMLCKLKYYLRISEGVTTFDCMSNSVMKISADKRHEIYIYNESCLFEKISHGVLIHLPISYYDMLFHLLLKNEEKEVLIKLNQER